MAHMAHKIPTDVFARRVVKPALDKYGYYVGYTTTAEEAEKVQYLLGRCIVDIYHRMDGSTIFISRQIPVKEQVKHLNRLLGRHQNTSGCDHNCGECTGKSETNEEKATGTQGTEPKEDKCTDGPRHKKEAPRMGGIVVVRIHGTLSDLLDFLGLD